MVKYFVPAERHLVIAQKLKIHAVQLRTMGSHNIYNYIKIYVKILKTL